jgi:hypothetical protein
MTNLKPYYDAALKADDNVKRILAEMDAAFNEGTEDGKRKALDMRPELDEAQEAAREANKLYASVRDASLTDDKMAALFTTPPDTANESDGQQGPKSISLKEYQSLAPRERLAFAKNGGQLTE